MLAVIVYAVLSFTRIFDRKNVVLPKAEKITEKKVDVESIPLVSEVAQNLEVPWAIDFLPDNQLLFTERSGKLKVVENGKGKIVGEINVHDEGESGLHGIAVDPDFESNSLIYVYYTTGLSGDNSTNRVERYKLTEGRLSEPKVLIDNIPGARIHDGGRIKFGPDGFLYIATGDAAIPSLSQNTNSLAGKILRIDRDGNSHPGNPLGNAVYSYGHRNPQGITWDNDGQLYATEHGNSATDEFNKIEAGANYGWPTIRGSETRNGMMSPIIQSGSNTWAPAGLAFTNNKFYFGGLRGNALFQVERINNQYMLTEFFTGEFGRIREVVTGPDGMLYISTSNKDGRGIPSESDDRIIRVNPFIL